VEDYAENISDGRLAVFKGHLQTEEDILIRNCILEVACHGKINTARIEAIDSPLIMDTLKVMHSEGILKSTPEGFEVTEAGRAFIRNVCSVFDQNLKLNYGESSHALFSKTI
jgi:oxygen-independent coproporphyrinogen-3 oxidase